MRSASFTVPGEPTSKARPRVTRKGNTYTPASTVRAEEAVRSAYLVAGHGMIAGPDQVVSAHFTFHRYERMVRDADNLIKVVLDALNGIAYPDDSQAESGSWQTEWVDVRADARTEVTLYTWPIPPRPPRRKA